MESKIATPQSVEIAKRLRSLRESVGLNPEQLSRAIYEKSGVRIGRNSIINYEVGESYNTKTDKNLGMRSEYVIAFADFYGVSADYLLGLSNTPSRKEDVQSACKTTGLTETAINKVKNFQDKAALSAVLESQKLFDLIKAIADSAKYAGNRGHLIAEHMMQAIQGKRVTVPGEDLDYIFLGKTIDATVKLFHEVSARLYNEKKKEE